MNLSEITDRVNRLGSAWEEFKSVNDRRLREIESKGRADPLTTQQLNTISDALDQYKSRVDRVETALGRPGIETKAASFKAEGPYVAEYRDAFCNYLRKGQDAALEAFQSKALSVSSDPDGGYLVTPTLSQNIVKTVHETSPMRQLASVEVISSDALELLEDKDEAVAGWTSEIASVSDTTTPQIGKKNIPVHELYAQPKATQKLVDDAAIDIEAWLSEKVAEIFVRKENTAFISGSGVGQPRGILTYTAGTSWGQIEQVDSGTDATITADGLVKLYYALKEDYALRSTFLMNRASVQAVRLLKESTTDQYLWQPGLAAGAPDTLMGVPVMQATDVPTPASDSLSVILADFQSAYQIVDRTGIRILRDPFTDKPFVKFYTTKRVGGDVVNFEAVKILKLAA